MVELRPYQSRLLEDIRASMRRGHRRVLAVMPTGAGKGTTIAVMVSNAAERGHRVLILAHRAELIADLSQRIHGLGINHGILANGYREDLRHPVQVGSVQTVVRRLGRIPPPSMIIQDEAHHLVVGNMWGRIIEAWPSAFLIGKTATPERLSGEGLGEGHGGYFQDMVLGPDVAWLTARGYLAPARVFAPPGIDLSGINGFDTKEGKQKASDRVRQAMGDPISHYRRTIADQHNGTAIAFCCSVADADALADAFRNDGIAAASLDGSMDRGDIRRLINDLGAGVLKVLTSCDLISEGIDIPSVTGAILLRPTNSLGLHLQQVGRVLRPCPGKATAIINDHVGNALRHGLPQDPREWSLEGRRKRPRQGEAAVGVRQCEACYCCYPPQLPQCPECGAAPVVKVRKLVIVDGKLQEIADCGALQRSFEIGDLVKHKKSKKIYRIIDTVGKVYDLVQGEDILSPGKYWRCTNEGLGTGPCFTFTISEDKLSPLLKADPAYEELLSCIEKKERSDEEAYQSLLRYREAEEEKRRTRRREQGQARTYQELVLIGKARGMRNPWGWAQRVIAGRAGKA